MRTEMDGLVFDPETHRYTLDGKRLPGVTTVLKPISTAFYRGVDPAVMEAAAILGQAVHKVIELDILGQLDTDMLDYRLLPYYRGWRHFLATSGFTAQLSEQQLASRRYRYAGTLDLFGRLNGIRSLIDAKRVAMVAPSTGPQTMAYGNLVREARPDLLPEGAPLRRYALQLKKPAAGQDVAPWHLHPFTDDSRDARVWNSCLNIAHYIQDTIS